MSLKHITVTEQNYQSLKSLGRAGDSFNDVITKLLRKNVTGHPTQQQEQAQTTFKEVLKHG